MVAIRTWLARRRIGVLMGGRSAERSISLKTGKAVLQSLQRQGFNACGIDASADLPFNLRRKKIQAAYLALHGPGGEDGTVQGLLETMGIPYTGSGVLASALAMDKIASKRIFGAAGIRTPRGIAVRNSDFDKATFFIDPASHYQPEDVYGSSLVLTRTKHLGFPLVVKPSRQGSALGVSIVKRPKELTGAIKKAFNFDSNVLIEEFIRGPEITVGILGRQTLPIVEIVPTGRTFYDFQAKYAQGGSRHILPARISTRAAVRARASSIAACAALDIRAVARVDLIVGPGDKPVLLEVNTIPGMTQTSLLPDAAAAAGIDFDALVLKIAEYSFVA